MAYPQPDANAYAAKGYDYFRLNTLLASGGDIYESEQGCLGFAIGPESDIANVAVSYFDEQAPNFLNQFVISPSRSFVGRVDANAENGQYTPANRPARIFIAPSDLWNPLTASTFSPHGSGVNIVETPRLDVIQYFKNVPSLVPHRRDKTWIYQSLFTGGGANLTAINVPYYGRRYAKIIFTPVGSFGDAYIIQVNGADFFQRGQSPSGKPSLIVTPLQPLNGKYSNVAGIVQFIIDGGKTLFDPTTPAAEDSCYGGMYDLLQVVVRNTTAGFAPSQEFALKIITSDIPGGATS